MARRVLVVDDDELTPDILTTILDLEQFDVDVAEDGETALTCVTDRRPDVVVLDVMMPGIDGFEVCRRIKDDPSTADLPVVLLTARDTDDDRRRGHEAGCDAYLTKPFSPLSLIMAIDQLEGVTDRGAT